MVVISLVACTHKTELATKSVTQKDVERIESIMEKQETAWSSGDLESFMQPYWKSDSLLFIGSRGITYGWNTTLSNYKKSYKNADEMGTLLFKNERIEPIQSEGIWVAGSWTLLRSSDTLGGSYLLVWKKIDGKWQIVADHSS
jgi:ketosteroid isomerase-like protein